MRTLGFDETTKLGLASLTSNVQIEPTPGAKLEDVILRAAYCPLGGTAELQVQSIETKCFSRLRDFLRRWRGMFERMYPDEKWTGPDPALCSLHRLGGGGGIISDTCTTARKARRLLADMIAEGVQSHVSPETWAAMTEEERAAASRTHEVDCWQHMRNIFLAEMSAAQVRSRAPALMCTHWMPLKREPCPRPCAYVYQTKLIIASRASIVYVACAKARHVKAELQPELDTFAAWERMSAEFSQLLRASFKEFHHMCRYYKGQGRSFVVWLLETYPTSFCIHLERADGGRQANNRFLMEPHDEPVMSSPSPCGISIAIVPLPLRRILITTRPYRCMSTASTSWSSYTIACFNESTPISLRTSCT